MSGHKDITEPGFVQWFNEKFATYALTSPDPAVEPCIGPDGRVKRRGDWDEGPVFSATKSSTFEFMKHQMLVRDFMTEDSPYRGILLYHGLGSGKTCTAIAVSEQVKSARQVVVMTPASLRENFIQELKKCGEYGQILFDDIAALQAKKHIKPGEGDKAILSEILKKYFFISYDASNTPSQVRDLPDGLNNKLLIIDEVHNLISMINSKSKKGMILFEAIMNATNLKLVLLSGTPIINDPFEVGILANLLTGYLDSKGNRHSRPSAVEDRFKHLLFDTNVNFYYHFVDDSVPTDLKIKNPIKLKRRLVGLFSYYGGLQPRQKILPQDTHYLVPVEMSLLQYEGYEKVRKLERESEKKMRRRLDSAPGVNRPFGRQAVNLTSLFSSSPSDNMVSNFRAFSRQFCNFVFPPDTYRYVPRLGNINAKPGEKDPFANTSEVEIATDNSLDSPDELVKYSAEVSLRHNESLKQLDEKAQQYLVKDLRLYSPKMQAIIDRIFEVTGPVYVYSQFRTLEGIGVFSRVLKAHGLIEYGWGDIAIKPTPMAPLPHTRDVITGKRFSDLNESERKQFKPLTYMLWPRSTGNPAKRNHLLNTFNSEDNKHGGVIKVFLSTKAGAEGINLMNVRQVHIMEPYWNDMRVKQAVGRAIRQCSHATLPPAERKVDVFYYVSTIDTYQAIDKTETGQHESTDQYVRSIALRKKHIIERVEKVMKEVAFDCKMNRAHNRLEDPTITCFEPIGGLERPVFVDLAQDPGDAELLGDKAIIRTRLVKVRLPAGTFRVTEDDMQLIQSHAGGQLKKSEEVNVYDLTSLHTKYKLVLRPGKPLTYYSV